MTETEALDEFPDVSYAFAEIVYKTFLGLGTCHEAVYKLVVSVERSAPFI